MKRQVTGPDSYGNGIFVDESSIKRTALGALSQDADAGAAGVDYNRICAAGQTGCRTSEHVSRLQCGI